MNVDDFLCEMQEIGLETRLAWKMVILEESLRIEFTQDDKCLMRNLKLEDTHNVSLLYWPFDLDDMHNLVTWFTKYPVSEIETNCRSELTLQEVNILVKELNRRGYFKTSY